MGEQEKKYTAGSSSNERKKKWGGKKKHYGNKQVTPPAKFRGGKDELDGNHFDCTGYGQSDRFMKTIEKIADHVGQEYKSGGVTRTEVMTQSPFSIAAPARPTGTDVLDISDYQNAKKIVDFQVQHQLENRQKVYSLVWQQCTESMHAKVKAHREFRKTELALDGIELLRIIKLICFNIEDEKYVPQKVHETKASFYSLKQGRDSDQAYQIKFLNTVQVIDQCGASLGEDPLTRTMVCKTLGLLSTTDDVVELAAITKAVRDYTLGTALILGADPDRYSGMIRGLKNASLAGRDEWPKNVTDAYNYLSKWEGDESNHHVSRDFEGVTFTNDMREAPPWHSKLTCRNCQKVGHIAKFCKNAKSEAATSNVQDGEGEDHVDAVSEFIDAFEDEVDYYADLFLCENQDHLDAISHIKVGMNGGRIPKEWVLLDNQSTTDSFSNPDLLSDIHEVGGSLTIHTQAGKATTKLRGTVPGYGEVWYCPDGIANILSLANVAKTRSVKFDSTNGNHFVVTKDNGGSRIFKQSEHGLFYHDMGRYKAENKADD
jgi:hypothetical protein